MFLTYRLLDASVVLMSTLLIGSCARYMPEQSQDRWVYSCCHSDSPKFTLQKMTLPPSVDRPDIECHVVKWEGSEQGYLQFLQPLSLASQPAEFSLVIDEAIFAFTGQYDESNRTLNLPCGALKMIIKALLLKSPICLRYGEREIHLTENGFNSAHRRYRKRDSGGIHPLKEWLSLPRTSN